MLKPGRSVGEDRRVLPVRADRRNVVLGVARRDARRATRAAREIDRHRPTTLGHAERVVRVVQALVLALIGRRRRAEIALRVGRDRRAQARAGTRGSRRPAIASSSSPSAGRLVELRRVDRLRDAASVLARRAFGARQRARGRPSSRRTPSSRSESRPPAASVPTGSRSSALTPTSRA